MGAFLFFLGRLSSGHSALVRLSVAGWLVAVPERLASGGISGVVSGLVGRLHDVDS
jgi:hypothetical protein